MAGKTEEINIKVKSDIGDVTNDVSDLASEFKIMGVSVNSVKKGLQSLVGIAKKSFATMRAGIASTGIGLLVIAFASLMTWFKKTKKGAETLERIFVGLGAAVNVIVDRVAKFGGAIVKLFKGDVKGAFKNVKAAFSGIGKEIMKETALAISFKRSLQELTDAQRSLNVETAKRRSQIEQLKLIAEDVSKSEKERLDAAKEAFRIETDLLDQRLHNAEEAVRLQKLQMSLGENMAEDLDALAQKEIDLANIRAESTTKQIELNNKINAIEAEIEAKRIEASNKRLERIAKEKAALQSLMDAQLAQAMAHSDAVTKIDDEMYMLQAENAQDAADRALIIQQRTEQVSIDSLKISSEEKFELKKQLNKKYDILRQQNLDADEQADKENAMNTLSAVSGLASSLSSLAGDNKELQAASAIIDTYVGANKALAQGGALGFISAAAVVAAGLANVKKIYETKVEGSGGGGSSPGATAVPPASSMVGGAFTLGGGEAPEPMQAYVVSDDITNNQNKLATIRRRATI